MMAIKYILYMYPFRKHKNNTIYSVVYCILWVYYINDIYCTNKYAPVSQPYNHIGENDMGKKIDENYMNRIKASIVDSFTDFISIANTDREIIYFNPAAYEMMGYGPGEKPEITSTKQLHAEGFDDYAKEYIQPAVFENGYWTGVSAIKHKDGSTIDVEMTVFPLYGENHEEYGTVAVIRDIDQLTRVNEKLRKNSVLFQKVMDSAKIGIVLINMETHKIENVNKHTTEMFQMNEDEIVGHNCYDILCHNSLDLCPHINERDKDVIVAERFIKRKDDSMLPIIKTGTWIRLDDKDYLVDTFVDISIQKELEKNLQEAKTRAEAANHSKSEFLSRMSHEMRTPLNAIIGMTQITEKTEDVARLKECIETIRLSSNHMLEIINDVLDLSKIEEGKLELSIRPFSVKVIIEKMAMLTEPKVREKSIIYKTNIEGNLPDYLEGDSLRLSQVLLNFLSNAIKFTPEKKNITLEVKVISTDNTTAEIYFAVMDEGIGITEEQLSRLFNPFTQAEDSTSSQFGGTGLGLSISKKIINLMDSDIYVDSEEGKGSKFYFTVKLPIADGPDKTVDTKKLGSIKNIFKGINALIVDDIELNRIIAMELLAETGISFDEAYDGSQAVSMATSKKYDVIIMDIHMPIMGGYEATRKIRAAGPPYSDVPIIAMSGDVFQEDIDKSKAEGMNAHIGKPVDGGKLIELINGLIFKNGDDDKQDEPVIMSFNDGIEDMDFDRNYFNYEKALVDHGNNSLGLAILLSEFLKSNYGILLNKAMDKQDYSDANGLLELFIKKADEFSMPSIASYAALAKENLKCENYEYAKMYISDLEKSYDKTCEILKNLLNH